MRKTVKGRSRDAVYIGRPTSLGNPFIIGRDGTRAEVIEKYRTWFLDKVKNPEFAEWVRDYCGSKDLSCWCAPLPCHGDVIIAWLNEQES